MKRPGLLLLAAIWLGPASAKAPERVPLPVKPNLPVEIVLAQKDGLVVRPVVNPMAVAYSGALTDAIGEMQGNASVKKNMPRLQEIRARVADLGFDGKIEQRLRSMLESGQVSPNPKISVHSQAWTVEEALAQASESDGVFLRVVPFYGFDAQFNALEVSIAVTAHRVRRTSSGKGRVEPVLYRSYSFYSSMPDQKFKVEDASARRWQRVSDETLRAAIEAGIAETTAMMAYDLSPEGQAEFAQDRKWEKFELVHARAKGVVAKVHDGRTWYRQWGDFLVTEQPVTLGPVPTP